MSTRIAIFLIELGQDPAKLEEFWQNPDSVLNNANLLDEEKIILKSRDPQRIGAAILADQENQLRFLRNLWRFTIRPERLNL